MAVYWMAAITLQMYGLNCYIMIFLFRRRRHERGTDEQDIVDRFHR